MSMTPVAAGTRTEWEIDLSRSSIRFSARHLSVAIVHGRFDRWTGGLILDDSGFERAQAKVWIDAASVDTQEPKRDERLRSADFLNTAHHPEIMFCSTRIAKAVDGAFQMAGELTIAGVTRRVVLDVEFVGRGKDARGAERVGFTGVTTIDRRDFGLAWSEVLEGGGLVVGEKLKIEMAIEAVRRAREFAGGGRS
jgi:polyisoprenoid-binding protein YceI